VRVLRATGLDDVDRRRLAEWVVSRIGDEYDLAHAWALARALLRLPFRAPGTSPAMPASRRFICSSLLAQAFLFVGCEIPPVRADAREAWAPDLRFVTPCDFERAGVFKVVKTVLSGHLGRH